MKRLTIAVAASLATVISACETQETAEPATEGVAPETEGIAPEEEQMGQEGLIEGEDQEILEEDKELVAGQAGDQEERQDAKELLDAAAKTVQQMKQDAELRKIMARSHGVFVVPRYGRAGVGVGGRGGQGVLLARQNGKWSDPVFYDVGGVSVGPQIGAEGGEIAMLLMSEQALDSFKEENAFSLNAGAKFTIVDYSKLGQASAGKDLGDVIFWSGAEGAFVGATLSATNISWDDSENPAYYGTEDATPAAILGGKVKGPTGGSLQKEMADL